jgi:predicted nucleic acid-binding protein
VLLGSEYDFFVCESVLVELFRRKEKIVRLSKLSEEDVVQVYLVLLRRLTVYKEALVAKEHWRAASELCKGVDETDTPHVALTLALNGLLWSGDKRLREGLEQQGFHDFFTPEP